MKKTFSITLPTPPSYHACQGKNRKGGYKTKKYLSWIAECQYQLNIERKRDVKFDKPVIISLFVNGGRMTSDIDNYIKQFLDLLVMSDILVDDNKKYVGGVWARWCELSNLKNKTIIEVREL